MEELSRTVQAGLGSELRAERKKQKISTRSVERHTGVSYATICRTERGERPISEQELIALCALYGITGSQRERMLERARSGENDRYPLNEPFWSGEVTQLIALESEAIRVTDVAVTWLPGLLQTPDYAHQVVCDGTLNQTEEDWTLRTRLGRQWVLYTPNGPQLRMIIDETALIRPVGGPIVMADQLDQLLRLSKRPNITIQMIPLAVGAHTGLHGSFTVLEFAERDPYVNMSARSTGVFLSQPGYVRPFLKDLELLEKILLNEQDSRELITKTKEGFEDA